jgi:hypothetical protein
LSGWRLSFQLKESFLKHVLEAAPDSSPEGLSHDAYATFDAAQTTTAWGRHHARRFALADGADVPASATQYDPAAVRPFLRALANAGDQ